MKNRTRIFRNGFLNFHPLTIQMALPVTIFDQPIKQAAWSSSCRKNKTPKISGTASPCDLHAVDVDVFPVKISASNLIITPLTKNIGQKFTTSVVSLKETSISPEDKGFFSAGPLSIDLQNISGDWEVLFRIYQGILSWHNLFHGQFKTMRTLP